MYRVSKHENHLNLIMNSIILGNYLVKSLHVNGEKKKKVEKRISSTKSSKDNGISGKSLEWYHFGFSKVRTTVVRCIRQERTAQ